MSRHTPESIIRCAALEVGPGSEDPDFIGLSRVMRAAPDLLKALEMMVFASVVHGYEADSSVPIARAAIAKARGEK